MGRIVVDAFGVDIVDGIAVAAVACVFGLGAGRLRTAGDERDGNLLVPWLLIFM